MFSKILNKWLDDQGYLDQNKFRQWVEKVMTKTYGQLKKLDKDYELVVDDKTYILKQYKKNGPAFTIYVKLKDNSEHNQTMDVDLVPCLEFDDIMLDGYRQIPNMTKKLIVVAKPSNEPEANRLWRLSFYEQEKQILQESEAGKLKPIIRLLKKFRDRLEWNKQLASYYIETLCLNELTARKADKDIYFFRAPKTCLFFHMLKKLCEAIYTRSLPYFWHKKHNLLDKMEDIVSENYTHRLYKILSHIEKTISSNRFIIAEYILSTPEVSSLRDVVLRGINAAPIEKDPIKSDENIINNVDLVKSMETLDITDLVTLEQNVDTVDSVQPLEMLDATDSIKSEVDINTTAQPLEINDTANTMKSTTIESRFEFLCDELTAFSTLKEKLSSDQIEKLSKSCMSLFITLSRKSRN